MNLLATICRMAAEAFVAGLWQGMVLVTVVAAALRMVPRLGATGRFAGWGLTFVAAVGVPFVHFSGHADGVGSGGVRVGVGWGIAIAGCWGLLMAVRLGRLVGQAMRLRRIWKDAVPVEPGEAIAGLLGEMPRTPVLCTSGAVDAPSVIGFRAPKLLIPDWQMGRLTEGEMRQIVLHECEHLRRGDDWMNLAQKVGLALFPLNPALLWADRQMGLERELACDAGVVARTRAPFEYAECLTRLAEQRLGRRSLGLALSAWGRKSELGRRVYGLLRPTGSMGPVSRRVSLGVLAMMVARGSLELARVPRMVSFAEDRPVVAVAGPAAVAGSAMPAAGGGRMMPVVYQTPVGKERRVLQAHVAGRQRRRRVAEREDTAAWRRRVVPAERAHVLPAKERMVLTSAFVDGEAPSAEQVRFRLVDAVSVSGSYTAVPFGSGWLVFQL